MNTSYTKIRLYLWLLLCVSLIFLLAGLISHIFVTEFVFNAPVDTTSLNSSGLSTSMQAISSSNPDNQISGSSSLSLPIEPNWVIENKQTNNFGLSIATTLYSLNDMELNKELDDMVQIGVGWLRMDFSWNDIQPNDPDHYNWENIDRVVDAANQHHLKILPILTYTPGWARDSRCPQTDKCTPSDPSAFAHFTAVVTQRYAPKGVHAWEIWNEPNRSHFWMPEANVKEYAQVLRAASVAIKQADSSATIISGGLAPSETSKGNIAPIKFLSQLYSEGVKTYFDAVGYHPYSFPVLPSQYKYWSGWSQMSQTKISIRSVMKDNADEQKPIWITEVGAPTNGPGDEAISNKDPGSADHVNEELQAAILKDTILQYRALKWTGPLFWYSYKDIGVDTGTVENFFGLLRYDGTRKPAFGIYANLIASSSIISE